MKLFTELRKSLVLLLPVPVPVPVPRKVKKLLRRPSPNRDMDWLNLKMWDVKWLGLGVSVVRGSRAEEN